MTISPVYTSAIGTADWLFACLGYAAAMLMVYLFRKHGNVGIAAFAVYPALQALTLAHSYLSHGWYYAPGAGSQGTVPALAISLAMLVYLFNRTRRPLNLA